MGGMSDRADRVERFFNVPVIVAALLSLPVIVVEETAAGDTLKAIAAVLNWAIWIVFVAELVAMLSVVPNRRRWLIENPLDVVIVFLTPPVFPAGLQSLRILRLLRLVRLLKLAQVSHRMFSRGGLRYAALLALLTWIGGGALFVAAESDRHLSLWDGVWWAFGTMTLAGSGIQPDTTLGRIVAIAVTGAGILFVAFLTGAFAERFLAPEIQQEIDDARGEIGEEEAAVSAQETRTLAEIRLIGESVRKLELELKRLTGAQ